MRSPTVAEKLWREDVRSLGSILTGPCSKVEIHHPAGRTARQDKIDIGHRWLIPFSPREHAMIDHGLDGLMMLKELFSYCNYHCDDIAAMSLHEFEKRLYRVVCLRLDAPDDEVNRAIQRWHR